jgi:hypothetical protein
MSNTNDTAAPPAPAELYALGPQPDGGIIIRIRDDFDLMILRKSVEKQAKNAEAAPNTVGAIVDGEDPLLAMANAALSRLKHTIYTARHPQRQLDGTPIGEAIASNGGVVDVAHEVIEWADEVPRPRPRIGDTVDTVENGELAVAQVDNYVEIAKGFTVHTGSGRQMIVHAHLRDDGYVWRSVTDTREHRAPGPDDRPHPERALTLGVETADETAAQRKKRLTHRKSTERGTPTEPVIPKGRRGRKPRGDRPQDGAR